ncbi:diguanylate cyclase [Marinomonas ostreistagni]|uniref:diguanylate cyclase n=1 Tax=Marinomonas ostreistagni TaxID=359209 RepID=UPI00195150F0|nr:diguanylate cyclase [Marinomonas ostreistagni]MBM6550375.1 diguanylate cyclase [Marinomonas ostreistagni]
MWRSLGSFLLLHLCLFACTTLQASAPSKLIVLEGRQDHYLLSDKALHLPQDSAQTLQDVLQTPSNQWQSIERTPAHLGIDTSVWLKIPIKISGDHSKDWILELGWPNLSSVSWYLQNNETGRLVKQQDPAHSVENDRLSFPIEFSTQGSYTLYLFVSGAEKLILPIELMTPEAHNMETHVRTLFTGLFYGVLFSMLGYNLFLYIFLRDTNYAFYCLYVLSIIYYTLSSSSNYITFLWHDAAWLNDHAYRVSVPLAFLSASIFIRKFLSIPSHGGIVLKVSNLAISTWLILLLTSPFAPTEAHIKLIEISAYISSVIGLWISGYIWYKGNPSGKYLTIAWSPLMVATFVLMLGMTDIIPFSMDLYYLQNITFTIEVLLLSIALAERINREKAAKTEAQSQSLYYKQRSLDARHRELTAQQHALNVERQAREELEQKVHEKTRDLQETMAELFKTNVELERVSHKDGLTGLNNRRFFDDIFTAAFEDAIQQHYAIAVLMFDIDYFKKVNDQYGHQAGDECLRQIASVLAQLTNQHTGVCARYGGEEFCIILPKRELPYALDMAETLRSAVANTDIHYEQQSFRVTTSIGVYADIPHEIKQRDTFLKYADEALYRAKNNGRNCVMK